MSTDSCYSYVSCNFDGKDKHGKIKFTSDAQLTEYKESCSIIPKKEKQDMSFVGIVAAEGKILAFSDSKSTRYENGTPVYDGNVQKIFRNDSFIVVCSGPNSFPVLVDGKIHFVSLSDWMDKNIKETDTFSELYRKLFDFVSRSVKMDINGLILTAAFRNSDLSGNPISIAMANVCTNSLYTEEKLIFQPEAWFSGAEEYCEYFNRHRWELVTTREEHLRYVLEDIISKMEHKHGRGWYNPVGEPFCIQEF